MGRGRPKGFLRQFFALAPPTQFMTKCTGAPECQQIARVPSRHTRNLPTPSEHPGTHRHVLGPRLVQAFATRLSPPTYPHRRKVDVLTLSQVVKSKGGFADAAQRRDDIRHRLFVGWATEFFSRKQNIGENGFMDDGASFLKQWFQVIGPVDSRPRLEQNIYNMATFHAATASQARVDAWLQALEELTLDKKTGLAKAILASPVKDRNGQELVTIGSFLRSGITTAVAAWNADKGYGMDLGNVMLGLRFLTVTNPKLVGAALIQNTDFAGRWYKAMEHYRSIHKSASAAFITSHKDDLDACKSKFDELSQTAFNCFVARANGEFKLQVLENTFTDFSTKVHQNSLRQDLSALCASGYAKSFYRSVPIDKYLTQTWLDKCRRYGAWLVGFHKKMQEPLLRQCGWSVCVLGLVPVRNIPPTPQERTPFPFSTRSSLPRTSTFATRTTPLRRASTSLPYCGRTTSASTTSRASRASATRSARAWSRP